MVVCASCGRTVRPEDICPFCKQPMAAAPPVLPPGELPMPLYGAPPIAMTPAYGIPPRKDSPRVDGQVRVVTRTRWWLAVIPLGLVLAAIGAYVAIK